MPKGMFPSELQVGIQQLCRKAGQCKRSTERKDQKIPASARVEKSHSEEAREDIRRKVNLESVGRAEQGILGVGFCPPTEYRRKEGEQFPVGRLDHVGTNSSVTPASADSLLLRGLGTKVRTHMGLGLRKVNYLPRGKNPITPYHCVRRPSKNPGCM